MEHKDMTYLISSRLGGELVGRGSGLDAEADDAGGPRARAALPGDAAPTLNAAQLEAVTATEGYVRVIAGAGTGKTRALTERFAYLVNDLGIMPGNILCVTFTNKAANEMRHRIRALTGDNDTGFINTFHGFCVSVLQEDSHAVQYPKSFLVLDNADIDQMLQIIYDERGLHAARYDVRSRARHDRDHEAQGTARLLPRLACHAARLSARKVRAGN